ncbi:diguanylate cyclase (plasmid) [Cupriavidus necator N-1]|uniref:diguanylate cyclase n=1 Tax=Cupriavidus necator (strain ATCC 43291 / DSM 13513 / CCUG 52238 / LMG 8453 / N-1) TaxID=1042878 RepID=F8GY85_CUPNN|nr:GGDEF domain-containing protein [Cupriavidus necator]AEI82826.1 diguanylate cyclase [Cupriavidus necator N-1]MDX6008622.1 GGDEF domain-containing protein [Cupriavidus necator]
MLNLDLRSMSAMTGMINIALGIILLAFRRAYPASIKGLLPWALAPLLCALSTAFYAMDGQWPAVLVSLGGNALLLSGCALFYFGSQRFYGVPCTWKCWLALGIGCLAGISWFLLVHPDYRIRVLLLTTLLAAICLTHARLSWQHGRGFAPRFMALVLAFQGLVLLMRAATTLFQDAVDTPRFSPSVIQTTYIAAYCFASLFVCLGLLLTVSERLRAQFEYLAQRDDLTGVLSRRAVLHAGSSELKNRRASGQPLSLLLMDIDHFKRINDQHGHLVGDRVLAHFAQTVGRALRHTDYLGRFGGEEFVVLLPHTGAEAAFAVAERVRQAVEQQTALAGQPACTASLGLASIEAGEATLDELLARADLALYRAKADGRNRVEAG